VRSGWPKNASKKRSTSREKGSGLTINAMESHLP
jgi:hypothetical protein